LESWPRIPLHGWHGIRDLNNLIDPSLGWELLRANAINDQGQIVGLGALSGIGTHAFRYDHGNVKDLGSFGGLISYALGMNNRGDVVGGVEFRAMLYTDDRGIENLNDLIDPSLAGI